MTAIEYALIAALITVTAIGVLTAFGGTFNDIFQTLASVFGGNHGR